MSCILQLIPEGITYPVDSAFQTSPYKRQVFVIHAYLNKFQMDAKLLFCYKGLAPEQLPGPCYNIYRWQVFQQNERFLPVPRAFDIFYKELHFQDGERDSRDLPHPSD